MSGFVYQVFGLNRLPLQPIQQQAEWNSDIVFAPRLDLLFGDKEECTESDLAASDALPDNRPPQRVRFIERCNSVTDLKFEVVAGELVLDFGVTK